MKLLFELLSVVAFQFFLIAGTLFVILNFPSLGVFALFVLIAVWGFLIIRGACAGLSLLDSLLNTISKPR